MIWKQTKSTSKYELYYTYDLGTWNENALSLSLSVKLNWFNYLLILAIHLIIKAISLHQCDNCIGIVYKEQC